MPCSKCGGVLGCVCPPATPESEPPPATKCPCGNVEWANGQFVLSDGIPPGRATPTEPSDREDIGLSDFEPIGRPVAPPHEHRCPNPHCEKGLIRGTNGAVGCAVCSAPIRLGAPTIATTTDDDDPWFYCIKCGAGWDAPFDESGCPSCWLYAYLRNPAIGAAVRAALKKYCNACGGLWSEHPRPDCSAQKGDLPMTRPSPAPVQAEPSEARTHVSDDLHDEWHRANGIPCSGVAADPYCPRNTPKGRCPMCRRTLPHADGMAAPICIDWMEWALDQQDTEIAKYSRLWVMTDKENLEMKGELSRLRQLLADKEAQ